MADEGDVLSTGSDTSAGGDAQQQATESPEQSASQPQISGGSKVDTTPTDASSTKQPGRSNSSWANQRLIEKAVQKALQSQLQEHLTPFLEEFKKTSVPPAAQSQTKEDVPDYNDLSGWINRRVESLLQQRLQSELPKTLSQFESQLEGKFKQTTSMQEAKNYLRSQSDIGHDEAKLEEIEKVMTDNLLHYALEKEPLKTVQKAVDMWRKSKTNPNAPQKAHLTTVTGGTGNTSKREPSIQELIEMQKKLAGGITTEDQEKLFSQIESLMKAS